MSAKISNIEKAYKKGSLQKQILKDFDMRITKKFVPSEIANYTIDLSPISRAQLTIADDVFSSSIQQKTANGTWKTIRKKTTSGSLKKVEDAFIEYVKNLVNIKIK